jgi:hypothetical protein
MVTSDALDGEGGWLSVGVLAAAVISPLPTLIVVVAAIGAARMAWRFASALRPAERSIGPRRNLPQLEAALDRELERLDRELERLDRRIGGA